MGSQATYSAVSGVSWVCEWSCVLGTNNYAQAFCRFSLLKRETTETAIWVQRNHTFSVAHWVITSCMQHVLGNGQCKSISLKIWVPASQSTRRGILILLFEPKKESTTMRLISPLILGIVLFFTVKPFSVLAEAPNNQYIQYIRPSLLDKDQDYAIVVRPPPPFPRKSAHSTPACTIWVQRLHL